MTVEGEQGFVLPSVVVRMGDVRRWRWGDGETAPLARRAGALCLLALVLAGAVCGAVGVALPGGPSPERVARFGAVALVCLAGMWWAAFGIRPRRYPATPRVIFDATGVRQEWPDRVVALGWPLVEHVQLGRTLLAVKTRWGQAVLVPLRHLDARLVDDVRRWATAAGRPVRLAGGGPRALSGPGVGSDSALLASAPATAPVPTEGEDVLVTWETVQGQVLSLALRRVRPRTWLASVLLPVALVVGLDGVPSTLGEWATVVLTIGGGGPVLICAGLAQQSARSNGGRIGLGASADGMRTVSGYLQTWLSWNDVDRVSRSGPFILVHYVGGSLGFPLALLDAGARARFTEHARAAGVRVRGSGWVTLAGPPTTEDQPKRPEM